MTVDDSRRLGSRRKREFKRQGFLIVEDGIDRELALRARDQVYEAIPEDPDDYEALVEGGGSMDGIADPTPFEAINDRLFDYGERLVGEGALAPLSGHGLTLRYPSGTPPWSPAADQLTDTRSHIDGHGGTYRRGDEVGYFTCFAMVYLDRVPPQTGGFTVWPGSHLDAGEYYQDHARSAGYMGTMGRDPDGGWDYGQERSDQFDGFEIHGDPGTVIVAHQQLEHCGGVNNSRRVRISNIKRLSRADADEIDTDRAYRDVWQYWPAMREIEIES